MERLIEGDDIGDKAARGITKVVIDRGLDALSDKQRYVFKTQVEDKFPQPKCEECSETIPWDQAYEHIHSPGRRARRRYGSYRGSQTIR